MFTSVPFTRFDELLVARRRRLTLARRRFLSSLCLSLSVFLFSLSLCLSLSPPHTRKLVGEDCLVLIIDAFGFLFV